MGSSAWDKAPCLLLPGLHSVLPQTTRPHPCKVSPATDLGRGTEYSREVSILLPRGYSVWANRTCTSTASSKTAHKWGEKKGGCPCARASVTRATYSTLCEAALNFYFRILTMPSDAYKRYVMVLSLPRTYYTIANALQSKICEK